jgi:hypothetical protein
VGAIVCDTLEANTIISDLEIEDPLIHTALNNPADLVNTGVFSEHESSGKKYSGLLRSRVDKSYYLSNNDATLPTSLSTLTNRQGALKMGSLDALTIACDDIDASSATTLQIGKATATKVEIGDSGVVTEIQGDTDMKETIYQNGVESVLVNRRGGSQTYAIGDGCFAQLGVEDDNVGYGYRAGHQMTTGNGNIFLGRQAGVGNSVVTGSAGNSNICLGFRSQCKEAGAGPSYNDSIALGCGATILQSNECVIGGPSPIIEHIRPGDDESCDLGTTNHQFKDAHLSGVVRSAKGQFQGSTGLYSGGVLSINTTTTFDLTAGSGWVYAHDAINNGPTTVTHVSWAAQIGVTVTNIGVQDETYIWIDSTGSIVQSALDITNAQRRHNINIGVLIHTGATLGAVDNHPDLSFQVHNQVHDLTNALGKLNISGNALSPETLLTFSKATGSYFAPGENYTTNEDDPNVVQSASIDTNGGGVFFYVFQDDSSVGPQADIIPGRYDPLPSAGQPGTIVANNEWTIQRVMLLANNTMFVLPGQNIFSSLSNAIDGIGTVSFTYPNGIEKNGLLVGYIICKGNETDLNSGNAAVINANKFGSTSASSSQTDLQQAYDNSTIPQIVTTAATPLTIRVGGADTDQQLTVQDILGTSTNFAITGEGAVSATSLECPLVKTTGATRLELMTDTGELALRRTNDKLLIDATNRLTIKNCGGGFQVENSTRIKNTTPTDNGTKAAAIRCDGGIICELASYFNAETHTANVLPITTEVSDLGSDAKKYRDLHLSRAVVSPSVLGFVASFGGRVSASSGSDEYLKYNGPADSTTNSTSIITKNVFTVPLDCRIDGISFAQGVGGSHVMVIDVAGSEYNLTCNLASGTSKLKIGVNPVDFVEVDQGDEIACYIPSGTVPDDLMINVYFSGRDTYVVPM